MPGHNCTATPTQDWRLGALHSSCDTQAMPTHPCPPQHTAEAGDTHSSVSFLMPSHSLIFFCRAPFCVSHLGKEKSV